MKFVPIFVQISEFINKLQRQPEHIRKIILWSVVIIIGLGLAFWWIYSSYRKIEEFPKEKFIEKLNLPLFEEEIKKLPKMEIPELNEQKTMNNEQFCSLSRLCRGSSMALPSGFAAHCSLKDG